MKFVGKTQEQGTLKHQCVQQTQMNSQLMHDKSARNMLYESFRGTLMYNFTCHPTLSILQATL